MHLRTKVLSALAVLACTPALFAQLTSMSTDFSGSRLFFTTDSSQTGSDQPNWGKLFVADANGVRPLAIGASATGALLLQIFYSIRSEHMLMEYLDYNLLFRWFVGPEMAEATRE